MPSRWYEKGIQFAKLGRHKVALHCCDRALEFNPKDDLAWLLKGMTLEKLGQREEAVRCYERATDLNPSLTQAWYNRGALYGNFGHYRKALGCFEEAHRQGHPNAAKAIDSCYEMLSKEELPQRPKVESSKKKSRFKFT